MRTPRDSRTIIMLTVVFFLAVTAWAVTAGVQSSCQYSIIGYHTYNTPVGHTCSNWHRGDASGCPG